MDTPLLASTTKFEVWTIDSSEIQQKPRCSNSHEEILLSRKVIRHILPTDVTLVAIRNYHVNVDLDAVTQTRENSTIFDVTTIVGTKASQFCYPLELCRAAFFTSMVFTLQSPGIFNSATVDFMSVLMNLDIIPAYNQSSEECVIGTLFGLDSFQVYTKNGLKSAKQAFNENRLKPIKLTRTEASYLRSDVYLWTGVGSLASVVASNLMPLVDCISALSCEAVGIRYENFDPLLLEASRPHRGQMTSSTNIRMLMEGSKRVIQQSSLKETELTAFVNAPLSTGPAIDYSIMARKAIEIELNSFEPSSPDPGSSSDGVLSRSEAELAVNTLVSALEIILSASTERAKRLFKIIDEAVKFSCVDEQSLEEASIATNSVLKLWTLIQSVANSLAKETLYSLAVLAPSSDLPSQPEVGGAVEDDDDEETKKDNQRQINAKKKAVDVTNENLTPAQRAKIEAKQKVKADKKAAKAAKKAASGDGSVKALPIGAGSEAFKTLLLSKLGPSNDLESIRRLFDLFDLSEHGIGSICIRLLESLVSGGKRRPKIAKGARDFSPDQMRVREQAFEVIRRVFKRHGAVEIDTPVFELKEVLTGKYGEDSKLIYDLADQGGELLSLRYDLTVPFARYLAMNSTGNIKRFHIAKVYRRDQPQLARGRYREFYQCDFDIAGSFATMVADAEVITVGTEIISELPVGSFIIKLNHRKILDAIFEICGVPQEKFRPICSAVDKLDKLPWSEVKDEMVKEKGLGEAVADRIGEFVLQSGEPRSMWKNLMGTNMFGDHKGALEAMADLELLFSYLEGMGSIQYISFDLSLARGLDYYTGVIYEAVLTSGTSQVGSIAAGGRYDTLVGMFSPSSTQIPCVGISIGIERIFAIVERMAKELNILQTPTVEVYVASIGDKLTADRMRVAKRLWTANISCEYSHQESPKFKRQLDEVLERGIPFMVVFGTEEIDKGTAKVKDMRQHDEVEISLEEVPAFLLSRGCKSVPVTDQHFMNILRSSLTNNSSVLAKDSK